MTSSECAIDPKVGGVFRLVMIAGNEFGDQAGARWPVRGVFEEFDPPSRLVITSQAVDDDDTVHLDATTTVVFEDHGNGTTKITVHASAEAVSEQAPQMLKGMQQGWSESLARLAAFLPDATSPA